MRKHKAFEPKYKHIANILKGKIVHGDYPIGSKFPTEEVLCEKFEVSRYTIREALRCLRADNLINSRPGAGTTVVYQNSDRLYKQKVLSLEDLLSWSADKRFEIESIAMTEIDDSLAWTDLTIGESWLRVSGWGHIQGASAP